MTTALFALMLLGWGEVEVGDARVVTEGRLVGAPAAAFGGGVYLLVWQDGWPGVGATADVLGVRLAADTLKPLDPKPLRLCSAPEAQYGPRVSYNDGVFLVVWQDLRGGRDLDVRGVLLEPATGARRGAELEVAALDGNQARPAVAACGEGFLVVWQDAANTEEAGNARGYRIRGRRVSSRGEVEDPVPLTYADAGASPAACGSAGKVLVSWGSGKRRGGTAAALLDAATGELAVSLGTINAACQYGAVIAHDGAGNFMTASNRAPFPDPWGWGGPGAITCSRVTVEAKTPESQLDYGRRQTNLSERKVPNVVDAAAWKGAPGGAWIAGVPGGFPGTADGLWPAGWPAVAYAGGNLYLFAWVKAHIANDRLSLADADIWLRGMNGRSLEVRLPDRSLTSEEGVDETHPVLVAGSGGTFLFAYERIPPDAPQQIVVRRVGLR